VILDHRNYVVATGYNGVPAGFKHCTDPESTCPGAHAQSGQQLEECYAVHAEQNALLQCHDVQTIETVYCTTAPCITCTKLLLNTSAKKIMFGCDYPTSGMELWVRAGRVWTRRNIL